MFFENPPSAFDLGGLFGTHPSIEKRIAILEQLGGHMPAPDAPSAPASGPHPGPWG
jgi:hypothetical protein